MSDGLKVLPGAKGSGVGSLPLTPDAPETKRGPLPMQGATPPPWILRIYPHSYYVPAGIIFIVLFIVPTVLAFFFSLTRWTSSTSSSSDWTTSSASSATRRSSAAWGTRLLCGRDQRAQGGDWPPAWRSCSPPGSGQGLLRSVVFFPVLVSTVAVGITFDVLMHPSTRPDQQDHGARSASTARLVDGPPDRAAVRRPGGCLEGRRAGPGDLHRRDLFDPPRSTSRRSRSRAAAGSSSGTSSCRWPARDLHVILLSSSVGSGPSTSSGP